MRVISPSRERNGIMIVSPGPFQLLNRDTISEITGTTSQTSKNVDSCFGDARSRIVLGNLAILGQARRNTGS
jgi:hypothetical protein